MPAEGYTSSDVDVSADQSLLAIGLGEYPPDQQAGRLDVYHADTGDANWSVKLPHGFIKGIAISPDNLSIAVASRKDLLLADNRGQSVRHLAKLDSWIKDIAYSRDGLQLACSCDSGSVYIFETGTWQQLKKLKTDVLGGTIAVRYSHDGSCFYTAGADRMIKTWSSATYHQIRKSHEAPDFLLRLDISPDGRRIYSGGKDGSVTLWHTTLGLPVLNLPIDHSWILNGGFSPSGGAIAAGGKTGGLWVWKGEHNGSQQRFSNYQLPIICSTKEFSRKEQRRQLNDRKKRE